MSRLVFWWATFLTVALMLFVVPNAVLAMALGIPVSLVVGGVAMTVWEGPSGLEK